jgi:hypothetical protein
LPARPSLIFHKSMQAMFFLLTSTATFFGAPLAVQRYPHVHVDHLPSSSRP